MSAETMKSPPMVQAPVIDTPIQRAWNWVYKFIVFPIGQMIVFIAGAALLLTVLSYVLAFFVPVPRENINLAEQISKQLPGMIISGISIGFVYSMVALGYTLVYGVLKFINFAHSEIFMIGSVVGFEFLSRLAAGQTLSAWHPILLIITVVLLSMLVSGTMAVLVERIAYRPLRNAPRLVPLITAIGVSFVLIDATRALMAITRNDFNLTYPKDQIAGINGSVPLTFNGAVAGSVINIGGTTYDTIVVDGTSHEWFNINRVDDASFGTITVGGVSLGGRPVGANDIRINDERVDVVTVGDRDLDELDDAGNTVVIRNTQIFIVIGAVTMLVALNYFVNGTKWGRGIRAVSQDQPTAGLMGINVNRMISLTFFLGGAFGGAAGALYGLNVGTVTPYVGFIPGLKAFTAAVLGGIGNLTGALLGGLTLGLIETFLNGILVYFPTFGQRYTDIFAFSVLILILIFRPSGILGERVDEKV